MKTPMPPKLHLTAAVLATLLIATFFVSTVLVELFGSHAGIARVKQLIVAPGLWLLVPAIALTGASGFGLARGRRGRLVALKRKRMPFIAANGILVLVPSALVLHVWAAHGRFDAAFFALQGVELIAGAANLALMGLNVRDGLRLSGRLRAPVPAAAAGERGRGRVGAEDGTGAGNPDV